MSKNQFKILTVALPEFKELISGDHELSLAKVIVSNERALTDKHTLFDFDGGVFVEQNDNRTVLEHSRNVAYENLIESNNSIHQEASKDWLLNNGFEKHPMADCYWITVSDGVKMTVNLNGEIEVGDDFKMQSFKLYESHISDLYYALTRKELSITQNPS